MFSTTSHRDFREEINKAFAGKKVNRGAGYGLEVPSQSLHWKNRWVSELSEKSWTSVDNVGSGSAQTIGLLQYIHVWPGRSKVIRECNKKRFVHAAWLLSYAIQKFENVALEYGGSICYSKRDEQGSYVNISSSWATLAWPHMHLYTIQEYKYTTALQ